MPRQRAGSDAAHPKVFRTGQELRAWLEKHHASASELWVGLYKKSSGKRSITWPELVDQLLCFGWIDGIRKSVDEISYANRVTPRRPGSNWSAVNLRRMAELIEAGAVHAAGLHAYQTRDPAKAERYSFERAAAALDSEMIKRFRENPAAWRFFTAQPPSYRKIATWWVISAKREETRSRRLETLISDSAAGQRIALLRKANSRSDVG
jgi:uncharacterized protein YdeI (YjbR/CyaY-like superfamily)